MALGNFANSSYGGPGAINAPGVKMLNTAARAMNPSGSGVQSAPSGGAGSARSTSMNAPSGASSSASMSAPSGTGSAPMQTGGAGSGGGAQIATGGNGEGMRTIISADGTPVKTDIFGNTTAQTVAKYGPAYGSTINPETGLDPRLQGDESGLTPKQQVERQLKRSMSHDYGDDTFNKYIHGTSQALLNNIDGIEIKINNNSDTARAHQAAKVTQLPLAPGESIGTPNSGLGGSTLVAGASSPGSTSSAYNNNGLLKDTGQDPYSL